MATTRPNLASILAPSIADEQAGTFDFRKRDNNFINPLDIFSGPKPDQSPADFEQSILAMMTPADLLGALLFKNKPQQFLLRKFGVTSGETRSADDIANSQVFKFGDFSNK